MKDTVERFSNRVANYVKYRPSYPAEVLGLFKDEMGLTEASVIADIGSGPGISAKIFLENGNVVYGVEPNDAMRCAAEEILRDFPNFKSTKGTAEETTLPGSSVDFVTAAQAFHWFDRERTAIEFRRILKPGGHVVLIWNERQLDSTPFLREYEQFLLQYATDYPVVRHENITGESVREFLGADMQAAVFKNVQVFDFDGLKGRMLSASYMPTEAHPVFERMLDDLRILFDKHSENDRIEILYDTNIFYAKW